MSFLSFLIPSLVSAGSGLVAGGLSANAAGNAANTQATSALDAAKIQAQSAQNALDFQKQQFLVGQNNLAPWLNVGRSGLANLAYLMGALPKNTPSGITLPQPAAAPQGSGAPGGNVGYQGGSYYPNYGGFNGFPTLNGFGGGYAPSSGGTTGGNPINGGGQFGQNGSSGYGYPGQTLPPDPNNPYDQFSQDSYGPNGFLPPVSHGGGDNGNFGGQNWASGLGGGLGDGNPLGTALGTGGNGGVVLPESGPPGGGEIGGFTGEGSDGEGGQAQRESSSPMMAATSLNDSEGGGGGAEIVGVDHPGPAQGEGLTASQPTVTGTPDDGTLNSLVNPDLGGYGSLAQDWTQKFVAPTDVTEQNDPGYQFRFNQGMKALQATAAARGNLLSGGTAKAAQRYGQDYASNEYGSVYNRALGEYQQNYNIFQQNNTNKFNRLAALSGIGQQTASELNSAGQNYANNAGNLMLNSGNAQAQGINNAAAARASGYNNQANAYGNAISNAGSDVSQLLLLRQLYGG
jgi:hypothetical protein